MRAFRARAFGIGCRRHPADRRTSRPGFTLIELLVTLAILSVLIAAVAACLSGGLKVWDLARTFNRQDSDIAMGLLPMERDVANAVPFHGGRFIGGERDLRFSCLARAETAARVPREGEDVEPLAIWATRYYFDAQSKAIVRERQPAVLETGQAGTAMREATLTGLETASFTYTSLSGETSSTWDSKTSMPCRVGLQLVLNAGGDRRRLSCWMDLPAAWQETASGGETNAPGSRR